VRDLRAAFFERIVAAFHPDGEVARSQPGYRLRPSQVAFAQAVGEALEARSTLVAEAGTGIGKTFGYLVPALLSGGMVLVSTGTRTLQDQLFRRDLPRVRDALRVGTRVALLKGRANYVCRYHLRRNLEDGRFDRREDVVVLHRIDRFASVTTTGDRSDAPSIPEDAPAWARATSTRENCLGQDCPDLRECFVFKARQAAQEADLVVVNHHLLCADLALRDEGVADLLPTAQAIIFDEAHQLPDIASQFFGRSVSSRQLVEFARDAMREGLSEAADAADWITLNRRFEQYLRQWRLAVSGSGRLDRDRLIANQEFGAATIDVMAALRAFREPLQGAAERGPEVGRLAARAIDLERLLGQWSDGLAGAESNADSASGGDGSVLWADAGAGALVLHATPLSLAEVFKRHREAVPRAWVFVSATLAVGQDFSHFTGLLGLGESRCEAWPSPFNTPQQALLYVPPCGDPAASEFADRVAASITPLLEANRGRAFILCTSLRMVEQLAERLMRLAQSSRTPVEWLVQGQLPRNELLSRFRGADAPVLIGSASFWEGVDVVGDQLSLVVIDKLPFAPPDDPVLRARSDALRRQGGDPFGLIQLPAAAMALKQGAGRLIRSERDRGLLVICDERLVSRGYGRTLRRSLPAMPITRQPEEALEWVRRGHRPDPPGGMEPGGAEPVGAEPLALAPEAPPAGGLGRSG
jgi:ATP-dependent DNA helicase DinG